MHLLVLFLCHCIIVSCLGSLQPFNNFDHLEDNPSNSSAARGNDKKLHRQLLKKRLKFKKLRKELKEIRNELSGKQIEVNLSQDLDSSFKKRLINQLKKLNLNLSILAGKDAFDKKRKNKKRKNLELNVEKFKDFSMKTSKSVGSGGQKSTKDRKRKRKRLQRLSSATGNFTGNSRKSQQAYKLSSLRSAMEQAKRGEDSAVCHMHRDCKPGHCCSMSICRSYSMNTSMPCFDSCQCISGLHCFTSTNQKESICKKASIEDIRLGKYLNSPSSTFNELD